MMSQQADKILFNILPWQGITTVQGNKPFFKALTSLLDLNTNCSESIKNLVNDVLDCVNTDGYFYEEDSEFSTVKFNELIQLNLTKQMAFSLGEIVQNTLPKCNVEEFPVNVLFAFSKTLQAAAVGVRSSNTKEPRSTNRKYWAN